VYTAAKAFARRGPAQSLARVEDSLKTLGLGLKVFDAYRPYAATLMFFKIYPDSNFVADPRKGSRHNRGCAVDVTLIDRATGKEVTMPSGYDDFSERADPAYAKVADSIKSHRELLNQVMNHFGFTRFHAEWWHFDYNGWEKYPLMDISFKELEGKTR
jgi:zinc D-Ala-D-Ala dipeptidase